MPLLQDRGGFLLAMPPLPLDEWLEEIMETQGSQFLGNSNLRIKYSDRGRGERLSSDHFFVFVLRPPTKLPLLS